MMLLEVINTFIYSFDSVTQKHLTFFSISHHLPTKGWVNLIKEKSVFLFSSILVD